MMHGHEKSDSVIVAVKPANKVEHSAAEQSTAELFAAKSVLTKWVVVWQRQVYRRTRFASAYAAFSAFVRCSASSTDSGPSPDTRSGWYCRILR